MIKAKQIKEKIIKKESIWTVPLFPKHHTKNPEEIISSPIKKAQRIDYDLQSMITAVEMCEFVLEPQ
jgi:hypothetical protein